MRRMILLGLVVLSSGCASAASLNDYMVKQTTFNNSVKNDLQTLANAHNNLAKVVEQPGKVAPVKKDAPDQSDVKKSI